MERDFGVLKQELATRNSIQHKYERHIKRLLSIPGSRKLFYFLFLQKEEDGKETGQKEKEKKEKETTEIVSSYCTEHSCQEFYEAMSEVEAEDIKRVNTTLG
eukprot:TRINITY_DN3807_c0_g4_i1.p2 TRINITY_DN3807_c0_g4~~TRINITY_DN3807_c0_g4_i1.p2  ORF type:complete len:102 (+),score=28.74 TRINITY_DN3807_c0_g4_i1:380-685(+)